MHSNKHILKAFLYYAIHVLYLFGHPVFPDANNVNDGNIFQYWLRNRLISAGLDPVLSHNEKSCILSYHIQFSANIKCKIIMLKLVLFVRALGI